MKLLIHYISIICITLLIPSCKRKLEENRNNLVFRYNESANITSLDPAFAKTQSNIWACNQIFNGLVQLNDSLHILPDIAKSWNISKNGKIYTFLLRKEVYFHKIQSFNREIPVNAYDFEYSFNRLLDVSVASPGRWILQNVKKFNALNDSIFEIELQKPFPAFLGLLSMKYASVVPREAFENEQYNFRSHPIGTGPFQFKLWEENIKLVLRKNPLYFEKDEKENQLPYLEAIAITFLSDKQSGFLEFIQGKIDFISGLDPSYKDEILTQKGELSAKYRDDITMITGPYLNTEYLGFRMDGNNKAILDKRIRQAMNYGFDRQKMILYLRNNMGTAAVNGMIPPGLPSFNNLKGYDYNPEKARELVKRYKKATGDLNPQIILNTIGSYIDFGEYLQREWEKIGLQVQIDVNPSATLIQFIATGKVDFFRASWIADYPDAENYLSLFYSKNFTPNGPNYTHFKSPEFDKLYEQSFLETDDDTRYILYQKMDSLIIEEAPFIPLFYDRVTRFSRKNIEGLGINPLNLLSLKKVKKNSCNSIRVASTKSDNNN